MNDSPGDKLYFVCEQTNSVVSFKKLSPKQELELFEEVKKIILDLDSDLTVEDYINLIVSRFVEDLETVVASIESKEEVAKEDLIEFLYESITALYPSLDLSIVCNVMNAELMTEESDDKIITNLVKNRKRYKRLEKALKKNILGQEPSTTALCEVIKNLYTGLEDFASALLLGPTGTGKTTTGAIIGKHYSGKFFKINCAEYANGHEYAKLIGAPPGYTGFNEKPTLAKKAEDGNDWVFLFDEFEKAHHALWDFLLNLMAEGTVTDNVGNELDFSNSLFLFTSNQGSKETYFENKIGFVPGKEDKEASIESSIEKKFSPEFINRLDAIVYFTPLSKKASRDIVKLNLKKIKGLKFDLATVDRIVEKGFSEKYGARNLQRAIKLEIKTPLSELILNSELKDLKGVRFLAKSNKKKTEVSIIEDKEESGTVGR